MGLQRHLGRATGILVTGALGVTLLTGSSPRVRADEDSAPGQKTGAVKNPIIDIELVEARLQEALRITELKTGINYVLTNPALQYNKITLTLTGKPVDVVLRQIAVAAGADFWQDGGIYYIGPKGSAPKPPEPIITTLPDPAPVRVSRHYEKIKLQFAEPNAVLNQLGVSRGNALEDYEKVFTNNVMRMLLKQQPGGESGSGTPLISPFNVVPGNNTGSPVAPLVPTGPNHFENPINLPTRSGGALSLPTNGGDQVSHRDGQDGSGNLYNQGGIVERAGQFGGQPGGGFGQPGGGFGQPGGGSSGLQPGGGAGQPGGAGQNAGAQGLLPAGINPGDLLALSADNSILVRTDDPAALRELRDIIRYLDVKPRQVMIRAEFVTVTSNGTNGFGINWTFQKVNLIGGANTGFSTTNTAFLQFATGNLQTELSFILTSGQGRLVAAPVATTLNNLPVTFTQTTDQPVFLSTPVVTPGGTTVIAQTIVPIPVTQGLIVLPRINGDESLTLFGTAISTSVGAPITGPNGESFPNITQQTAPIQRIIRNGDTMVIAGLTSKNDVLTTNKVPLLGDLPLIGNLFRSRNTTTSDAELLVFITPTIIQERPPNNVIGGGAGGALTAPGGATGPGGGGGGVNPGGIQ